MRLQLGGQVLEEHHYGGPRAREPGGGSAGALAQWSTLLHSCAATNATNEPNSQSKFGASGP